jgi:cell division protein FtsB
MYGATFTAIKADGSEEMRKFVGLKKAAKTKTVSGEELHASDFAHVGDPEDTSTWKLPIHDASHVRNALARFNQTQGMSEEEKKAAKAKIDAKAKSFGVEVSSEKVAKSLWDVGRMADLLQTIYSVQSCLEAEAEWEGDGSDIPARLKTWLTEGVSILTDLAEEEGQELISKSEGDESMTPEQTALLEKATGLIDRVDKLEKMAAHHKAHVIAIKGHHEAMAAHIAALHDGADGVDGKDCHAKVAKIDDPVTPNAEVEALKSEVADLKKGFTDFLEELGKAFPKKSDLPAGAVAKAAGAEVTKSENAGKEPEPHEVTTPGGNKVDLAKFGRDILAKPLYVNPTIAR